MLFKDKKMRYLNDASSKIAPPAVGEEKLRSE